MNKLDERLKARFAAESFGEGVDQFIIVAVSQPEPSLRDRFVKDSHRAGTYKNPFTRERVRFVSIALPLHPIETAPLTTEQLHERIIECLFERLQNPPSRLPKGFKYSDLVRAIREQLQPH